MKSLAIPTIYLIFSTLTSGCLKLSEDMPNSNKTNNNSKEIKVVRNFLSYKTVSLKSEINTYKNISDVRIESTDGVNSVFITKESIYKNPIIKFNSTTEAVEISLRFDDGTSLSIIKR